MRTEIDELKEKARMKIIGKIRKEKEEKKIKPYEGGDAVYSSNDIDYAEFLEDLNEITHDSNEKKDAVSVEDTVSFRLNRKKEEEIKSEDPLETAEEESVPAEENSDTMPTRYMSITDDKLFSLSTSVERLTNIVENSDIRREHTLDKILTELGNMKEEINNLKNVQDRLQKNVADITKVSDSVFDLKNTQQGTKAAMLNLETSFTRLKKKFVACITLLSILSFIIIALEVLNLFS